MKNKNDSIQLDQLFEPIVIISNSNEIVYYNHQFTTFSKASPRILRKIKSLDELFENFSDIILPLIEKTSKTNNVQISSEIEIILKENKLSQYVVIKSIPINNTEIILSFNNFSVEKNLHDKYREQLEELKSAHNQIIQADKLATLGELSASLSHEINNPLAIAMGNSEILTSIIDEFEELKTNDLFIKTFNNISESLQRIKDIIINMKSFAYKSEERKQYLDFETIIKKSISMVDIPYKNNHVNITYEGPKRKIISLFNQIEIEQVIINLLKNALDSTVIKNNSKNRHVKIKLAKNIKEKCIQIDISDNGSGVDPSNLEQIFSPFYTTKTNGQGTGLGLSVSKKIIKKHTGTLFISRNSTKGSTFSIQLPMIEISSYTYNQSILNQINDENRKKILIVDDEEKILNIAHTFLEEEGHTMVGSTSPDEALDILGKLQIDMIITDLNMPLMKGSDFTKKIRKTNKSIPIIYLTSSDFSSIFETDRTKYNLAGLILKPFSKKDLMNIVSSVLIKKEEKK